MALDASLVIKDFGVAIYGEFICIRVVESDLFDTSICSG